MSPFSHVLFVRPSVLDGVARIFDFTGALNTYNYSRTPKDADELALTADWCAVGDDLWSAIEQADADYAALSQKG